MLLKSLELVYLVSFSSKVPIEFEGWATLPRRFTPFNFPFPSLEKNVRIYYLPPMINLGRI